MHFFRYKMSDHQQMQKGRRYIQAIKTQEEYDALLQFATSTFRVPVKQRTTQQNNARIRFYRNKEHFSAHENKLFYKGKEVVVQKSQSNIVNKQFHRNSGSGYRPIFHQLKHNYANVSVRNIRKCLSRSKDYQLVYAQFRNKVPPRPVTANAVNERWQMDLIHMKNLEVVENGVRFEYILTVIDVFSRFVMLRPLEKKTSKEVKHELSKLFAEHGQPDIIQCDQGSEFKGSTDTFLKKRGVKVIRSRPYHPKSQGKCEVSHVLVRKKISFQMRKKKGFNWAKDLHVIQEAMNL